MPVHGFPTFAAAATAAQRAAASIFIRHSVAFACACTSMFMHQAIMQSFESCMPRLHSTFGSCSWFGSWFGWRRDACPTFIPFKSTYLVLLFGVISTTLGLLSSTTWDLIKFSFCCGIGDTGAWVLNSSECTCISTVLVNFPPWRVTAENCHLSS